MPAGVTYEPLATANLAGLTDVTFSSIPQTYSDLVIHYSVRLSSGSNVNFGMRFNGNSSGNYSWNRFETVSGSTSGSNTAGQTYAIVGYIDSANSSAGTININDYADATYRTQVQSLTVGNNSAVNSSVLFFITAAISSITLLNQAGTTFASPSVATLYGIARA
jgi:hypothetical protein